MKKALQNPFLVGILAILALGIVVRTVFKKPESAYSEAVAAQEASAAEAKKRAQEKFPSSQKRIDAAMAEWTLRPERNPFRSRPKQAVENGATAAEIPAVLDPEVPPMKLSAIWLDDGNKLAVINGRVVDVGETILDFVVTEILPDRIILGESGRRVVLRFSDQREPREQRVAHLFTEP